MSSLTVEITQALDGQYCIAFWGQADNNGFLSNLYHAPTICHGTVWDTSEHIYQAQKHDRLDIREKIRKQKIPLKSKFISRKWCKKLDRWPSDEHKLATMRVAIKAKFDQHHLLRELLISTGDLLIIKNSTTDSYWGVGEDGEGKNMMGILLMELRELYIAYKGHVFYP